MKIVGIRTTNLDTGKIKGSVRVRDGKRTYTVKFEREPNGHWEQFGAHAEVLCFTYPHVERAINQALGLE